jgi:hypothetical protein
MSNIVLHCENKREQITPPTNEQTTVVLVSEPVQSVSELVTQTKTNGRKRCFVE